MYKRLFQTIEEHIQRHLLNFTNCKKKVILRFLMMYFQSIMSLIFIIVDLLYKHYISTFTQITPVDISYDLQNVKYLYMCS